MDRRIFLNNDVARITGVTARQVLAWSEKGLIVPLRETTGAGAKRGYDYVNLLEVYLCDDLFVMGLRIQTIKNILSHLRASGVMRAWAQDFNKYYTERRKNHSELFKKQLNELSRKKGCEEEYKALTAIHEKFLTSPPAPDKSVGTLMIFYSEEGENIHVIPWDIEYTIGLNTVRKIFADSYAVIVINLGKIKSAVDSKL